MKKLLGFICIMMMTCHVQAMAQQAVDTNAVAAAPEMAVENATEPTDEMASEEVDTNTVEAAAPVEEKADAKPAKK